MVVMPGALPWVPIMDTGADVALPGGIKNGVTGVEVTAASNLLVTLGAVHACKLVT